MRVKRIVADVAAADVSKARSFYSGILGLDLFMDRGWIVTFAANTQMSPLVSIASEGGSGTPVPDLFVEVDDIDEVLRRVNAEGIEIEYGPATEPWRVRRFYVRDPFGRLINNLAHIDD